METEAAVEILTSLAKGVNPRTGNTFSPKSPYRNLNTMAALLLAIHVLEKSEENIEREQEGPTNAGNYWAEEEERRLRTAFKNGKSIRRIAKKHGRTVGAIRSRLVKLGLIKETPVSKEIDI